MKNAFKTFLILTLMWFALPATEAKAQFWVMGIMKNLGNGTVSCTGHKKKCVYVTLPANPQLQATATLYEHPNGEDADAVCFTWRISRDYRKEESGEDTLLHFEVLD